MYIAYSVYPDVWKDIANGSFEGFDQDTADF